MPISSDVLSEIITTRLSHDLIGNIGAVSNAVELLEEDDSLDEVKPILQTSAFTLTSRLKFFRLAFGLSNASPQNISDVEETARNYLQTIGNRSTPIILDFQARTPALYKLILLSVMALGDVFIRGGKLSVLEKADGLFILAESPAALAVQKLAVLQNSLKGKLSEDNPAQAAPAAYMCSLLDTVGVSATLQYGEKSAELKIG